MRGGLIIDRMQCARMLFQRGARPLGRQVAKSLVEGDWDMARLLLEQGLDADMSMLEAALCGRSAACIENVACRLKDYHAYAYHAGALCAAVLYSPGCASSRGIALDLISRRSPHGPGNILESTAISLAAMHNDQELVQKLLGAISWPAQSSYLPQSRYADIAGRSGDEFIQKIKTNIMNHEPFWSLDDTLRGSPLTLAVLGKDPEGILSLLRHDIRPDLPSCCVAVTCRETKILAILLRGQRPLCQGPSNDHNHGLPSDNMFLRYQLPLHIAVSMQDFQMVSQLLSAGADINEYERKVPFSRSPLQVAAEAGDLNMTRFLLNRGACVNGAAAAEGGATALQLAVMHGHVGMVKMLLAEGADVNAPAALLDGRTCLQGAAGHGRLGILELLIANGVDTHGQQRIDYVLAVLLAERSGRSPVVTERLTSFGGWTEWDEVAGETFNGMRDFPRRIRRSDKARIEGMATSALSERTTAGNGMAEVHRRGQGTSGPSEMNIFENPPLSQAFPPSPWSVPGQFFGFGSSQNLDFIDLSTPSPCLDNESGWLDMRGPSFLRDCWEEDVADDEPADDEVWKLH